MQPFSHLFICAGSRRLYSEGPPKLVNNGISTAVWCTCSWMAWTSGSLQFNYIIQQLQPSHGQCCSSSFKALGILVQFCIVALPLWTPSTLSVPSRGKIPNPGQVSEPLLGSPCRNENMAHVRPSQHPPSLASAFQQLSGRCFVKSSRTGAFHSDVILDKIIWCSRTFIKDHNSGVPEIVLI